MRTRPRECGQGSCNKYGCHVVDASGSGWYLHTHSLQSIRQRLNRKHRLTPVSGSIQPHHDAIANQWILADTFDSCDISYRHFARLSVNGQRQTYGHQQEHSYGISSHEHRHNWPQKPKMRSNTRMITLGGRVPSLITPLPFNSSSRLLSWLESRELSGAISPPRTIPRRITVCRSLFIVTERSASTTNAPVLNVATTVPVKLVRSVDLLLACAFPCSVCDERGEKRL